MAIGLDVRGIACKWCDIGVCCEIPSAAFVQRNIHLARLSRNSVTCGIGDITTDAASKGGTVEDLPGVEKAKASASANTLTIKGSATEEAIRTAVEGIGYTFKGKA